MGRTLPTATLRVRQFERDWKIFAQAPRKVDREAFAALCAFAHFHAAAIAHAASPYNFEMILLAMLIGLVPRAESLQTHGIMQFYDSSSSVSEIPSTFQTNLHVIMLALRQRLASQKHELFTFACALRRQDQKTLRVLLTVTQTDPAQIFPTASPPSDEMLLRSLVGIMRRIRQLEKQYMEDSAIVSADEWESICAIM